MQELGSKPQNAVYVADNPRKDFIAPNKLGFLTVQLIRPQRLHTDQPDRPDAAARYVISDITELPDLFG